MTITWSVATGVTLSGGNLIATNTGTTATEQGARAADAVTLATGKFYFEVTFTAYTGGDQVSVGVGATGNSYFNTGNSVTNAAMMFPVSGSGYIWANGADSGYTLGLRSVGNVIGIAVDLTNRKIWFRVAPSGNWNGNATANPATNVNGVALSNLPLVPVCVFGGSGGAANNKFTANFGATVYVGTPPAGFGNWPYTSGTLYDEAVKFGYGKLLAVSTAAGASSIDFVAPLALDYDTFWFDFDSLSSSVNSILIIYVSTDNGASWQTSTNAYWSTFLAQPAGGAAASYSSTQLPETVYMRISQPNAVPTGAYPVDGRMYFNLGPNRGTTGGHRQFDWVTFNRDQASGGFLVASTGGGAYTGTAPNGVRFVFGSSTITGTIRCYGLKKGQGV